MQIGTNSIRTLVAASVALGLAACHPPHAHRHHEAADDKPMSVAAALTCPQSFDGLTRTGQAADGQSCEYGGPDKEQVSLRRVVLNGQTPQAAMASIEAGLRPLVPARAGPTPPDPDDADADDDSDHAKVDLPGVHVDARGDKADVRVLGITVHADGDKANVNVGHDTSTTVVNAGPDGAEIRSTNIDADGANLVFILTSDKPGPSAVRAAGYVARGPAQGPLVAAVFQSTRRHENWRSNRVLNGLLDLNVKQ